MQEMLLFLIPQTGMFSFYIFQYIIYNRLISTGGFEYKRLESIGWGSIPLAIFFAIAAFLTYFFSVMISNKGSSRPTNDENCRVLKEVHMDKQKNKLLILISFSFFNVLSAIGSSMACGPLLAYT
ncbi:MAG: hypothetical protein FWD40_09960 [Treponema sp.]|nr:hypothetical protein [Treponema sp.]